MEMKNMDLVAEMPCYTVVNAYEKLADDTGGAYESELAMERRFIHTLHEQGYEYLKGAKTEKAFKENLRRQMEKLNREVLTGGMLSDGEWSRFYGEVLAKKSDGIEEKTAAESLGLDATATQELLVNAFATRRLVTAGPDFEKILPPMPLFGSADASATAQQKRLAAESSVTEIYNRYRDDYAIESEGL